MAYTAIDDAGSFFKTLLYTGTGSSNAITGVGFQPDFTWIKNRDATDFHVLTDAVRGATKYIKSNDTTAETTNAESLKTFDSDGFTVGTMNEVNTNTEDFVSWNWKMGTTSGIATNGSTTITPSSYSFNATSGQSVLAYTGNVTAGAKLAHGLGAVPKMVIIKNYNSGSEGWSVYHTGLGNTHYIKLNTTAASVDNVNRWNDTTPDAVNITLGDDPSVNGSTTMVAYVFADVKGYSKFGSYTGNASATNGPFIYTGFRPAWILIKRIDSTIADWIMVDNKRIGFNESNYGFVPNEPTAETTGPWADILSNGFKIRTTSTNVSNSGTDYIYAVFAESPIVSSNDVPVTAR